MQHGVVDGACIEKKFSSFPLDKFYSCRAKKWGGINMWILEGLFVVWLFVFGWATEMMGGGEVFEFLEGIFNVAIQGANKFGFLVVQF